MAMSNKSQKKISSIDMGVDIVSGAAAALMYTEEEIRDVFSPEDAEEFLALRKKAMKQFAPKGYELGGEDNDTCSMAAEDGADY